MQQINSARLTQSPQRFDSVYRICSCQQRTARTGKNYLRITLEDATGMMVAYAWQQPSDQSAFTNSTHMRINGKSRFYNGAYVADIMAAEAVIPTPEQGIATLPYSQCQKPEVLTCFSNMILSIEHDGLRALLANTFYQERIVLPFIQAPASLRHHHNFQGGLMVHSLECATIIRDLSIFSKQEREIGITAALLHDLGKIKTIGTNFSRPEMGKAIDHEAITLELCASGLARLDDDFPEIGIDLRHILTCRSLKRWGHEPKLPIAHALQLADRLSSDKSLHTTLSGPKFDTQSNSTTFVMGHSAWALSVSPSFRSR